MPRKTAADHDLREQPDPASMRPRPDAAENRTQLGWLPTTICALQ